MREVYHLANVLCLLFSAAKVGARRLILIVKAVRGAIDAGLWKLGEDPRSRRAVGVGGLGDSGYPLVIVLGEQSMIVGDVCVILRSAGQAFSRQRPLEGDGASNGDTASQAVNRPAQDDAPQLEVPEARGSGAHAWVVSTLPQSRFRAGYS